MKRKEINDSILINRIVKPDALFQGSYTIDPYQNCSFGCIYCDSSFDDIVYIKKNAVNLLREEIKLIPRKRVIIGSVHDPYQPCEEIYQLTRSIISYLLKHDFPVHIITKSPVVLRDLDLLTLSTQTRVTLSIISLDQAVSDHIEQNVDSVQQRFNTIQMLNENNIDSGMALIPLLPGFIDDQLEDLIHQAKDHHASYVLSEHLFLKGDQKTIFFKFLHKYYPSFLPLYHQLFNDSMYPDESYQRKINRQIKKICGRYHLPCTLKK